MCTYRFGIEFMCTYLLAVAAVDVVDVAVIVVCPRKALM